MNIKIDKSILDIVPCFDVTALYFEAECKETSDDIKNLIKQYEKKINEEYSLEELLNIPLIKEARDSYKKFGKDPSRYRLAVESLFRRIIKGNELYIINNLVDIGNVLSLDCMRSTAVLDYDKIDGDILIRLGKETDEYYGIGRGLINITNIPLYEDNTSPFGSTTSDTIRTSITDSTKKVLVFIISFGIDNKNRDLNKAIELFSKYCDAKNIKLLEVKR